MKILPLLILITFLGLSSYSQLLKGEWEGYYVLKKIQHPIFLEFVLNTDSSYSVYSYSKGGLRLTNQGNKIYFKRDSVVVCKVYFKFLNADSIYLEEIEVIEPKSDIGSCFQKMNLKIKIEPNKLLLVGNWSGTGCSHRSFGDITFWKKRE